MELSFTIDGDVAVRVVVRLSPRESVALAASRGDGAWIEQVRELVVVGHDGAGDPLEGVPRLQARRASGELSVVRRTEAEQRDEDAYEIRAGYQLTADEAEALAAARRRGVKVAPEHPEARALREPPSPWQLATVDDGDDDGDDEGPTPARPEGPLALFAGPPLPREAFDTPEGPITPELVARVRAWPLPSLVGRVLAIGGYDAIPEALRAFLCDALGELPFRVAPGATYGGMGKHMHFHVSVVAPPAGSMPMAIELFGMVVAVGDIDLSTREGGRLLVARRHAMRELESDGDSPTRSPARAASARHAALGKDLPVPIFVLVRAATYANVTGTGVGVPLYL